MWIRAVCAAVVTGLAFGAPAAAQDARSTAQEPPASVDLDDYLARNLVRTALLDLRACEPPRPRDYAVAAILLEEALRCTPRDADLVRRWIEALWNAGDAPGVVAASRRLAELDPEDTVNQLRLITAAISREQTIDRRLSLYDKFLALGDSELDASVRSRLALDAALLMRESGDEKGFLRRLGEAMTLDSTNKEAALLAYNLYCQRVDDAVGRAELLSNLLMADPLDPNILTRMRDEMAAGGAVKAARRFHECSGYVLNAARVQMTLESSLEYMILRWLNEGPQRLLDELNTQLLAERDRVRKALAQTGPGQPTLLRQVSGKPEDRRLLPEVERIRCCLALALGQPEQVARSMQDMGLSVAALLVEIASPGKQGGTMSPEQAAAQAADLRSSLDLFRYLTNVDVELARTQSQEVISLLPEGDDRATALRAWGAYRGGDVGAALRISAGAPHNPWCIFLVAQAAADAGQPRDATTAYRAAYELAPLTPLGGLAAARAQALGPGPLTARAAALDAVARGVPTWIDEIVLRPRSFQVLSAEAERYNAGALDRVPVRIIIQNIAPIPIAIGSDKPISGRLLLVPNLETIPGGANLAVEPEVYEFGRRLRLRPGETVTAETWPEAGLTGWLSEVSASAAVRTRWRVIQGFQPAANGGQEVGPGSLEANIPAVSRLPLPDCQATGPDMVKRIAAARPSQVPEVLAAVRMALVVMQANTPAELTQARLLFVRELERAYPGWPAEHRLLAAALLPTVKMDLPELESVDAMIRADTDPRVRMVALVTRVSNPNDPALAAAEAAGDPRLARLAAIQRERAAEGARCLATMGIRARERPKVGDRPR